jgi:hypothetical protein
VIADATRPRHRVRCHYNAAGYRVCRR